jgi:hypothetical protein
MMLQLRLEEAERNKRNVANDSSAVDGPLSGKKTWTENVNGRTQNNEIKSHGTSLASRDAGDDRVEVIFIKTCPLKCIIILTSLYSVTKRCLRQIRILCLGLSS